MRNRILLVALLGAVFTVTTSAQTNWVVRRGGSTPYHLGGVAFGQVKTQPTFVAVSGPAINDGILTPFALTSPDAVTWTQREMDGTAPAPALQTMKPRS